MADINKILNSQYPPVKLIFSNQEVCLFALSINMGIEDQIKDLDYTYENHENFKIFPSMINAQGLKNPSINVLAIEGLPEFNPMNLLHGEQLNEYYKPFQVDVEYNVRSKIIDMAEKGKSGTVLSYDTLIYELDSQGKEVPVCKIITQIFIRKLSIGGYKGKQVVQALPKQPTSKPCFSFEEKTYPNQAVIYRLTGDLNPLHIDPQMAAMGGFDKPILHGLCFYSLGLKSFIQNILKGQQELVSKYHSRFVGSVFPGETVVYDFWKNGNEYFISGTVKERKVQCLIGQITVKAEPKL